MPPLTFDRVVKRFGDATIVEEFSLDVGDGELVVLVGGSGSGKSTILRMVAGLEPVTAGAIRIGERDITRLAPRERDVAMVFQDYALYPHMTVRENLSLGLRLRDVARVEIERRVGWASDMLGLGALLDRRPKQLSGGQRQRVAMGRAMVREPQVFLFDEPLSNLDAALRGQMRVEIGGLQRRLSTTTVYVTHDQTEAMTLGDRIVVLANGRIQQVGRPMDVYRHPANRFVAGFIGTPAMNFVEGRLETEGDASAFVADGLRVRAASRVDARGPATLGIRPDDLRIVSDDGAANDSGASRVRGRVLLVERLGAVSHVHLQVGPHRLLATAGDEPPRPGDDATAELPASRAHFFGADGRALPSADE